MTLPDKEAAIGAEPAPLLDDAYQAYTIHNRKVILSVSDAPVSLGAGTPLGDTFTGVEQLVVFAESLLLSNSVIGRNLSLHTAQITTSGNARLDVSGASGDSWPMLPKGDGKPGKPANHGGSIHVYAESATAADLRLSLTARGGDGGPGQSTADGSGGGGADGGQGGTVRIVFGSPFHQALRALEDIFGIGADSEGSEHAALVSKKAAVGKLASLLTALGEGRDDLKQLAARLQAASVDPLSTISQLDDLLELADRRLRIEIELDAASLLPGIQTSGGRYGVYGSGPEGNGSNGKPGTPGTTSVQAVGFDAAIMRTVPFVFAHPDQCQMLLRKAAALYYAGTGSSLSQAAALLERLVARLGFVEGLQPEDALYKAYSDASYTLAMPDALPMLASVYDSASSLLRQFRLGQDYYGRSNTYTPRGSHTFYDKQSQRLLLNLEKIEVTYAAYYEAQREQTVTVDMVVESLHQADMLIEETRSQIEQLKAESGKTAISIAGYEPVIKRKHEAVQALIKEAEAEIRSSVSLNFADVVEGLTMVAFAPTKAMTSLQTGNLIFKGITQLPDDLGTSVNKDYLIDSLTAIAATEAGLLEGYQLQNDGTLQVDDPGAAKLLAVEQDLMTLLNSYRSRLSNLKKLKEAFDDYVKCVIDRNNFVVHYNAIIALWINYSDRIQYYTAKKEQLSSDQADAYNPNLPLVAAYIAQMYQDAKSQVMESLYMTQRSLRFWSLTQVDAIQQVLAGRPLSKISSIDLTKVQSNLIRQYANAVENFGHDAQKFPAPSAANGIIYPLSTSQLDALKENNGVILSIPAVYPETDKSSSPFAGWANIRLNKVRVWLRGAKTADNSLLVSIRHFGKETIVDARGVDYAFSHDPITIGFKYNTSTNAIDEDGELASIESQTYSLVGPFATWRVMIEPRYNDSLDLSQVTEGYFEFFGTNELFH